MIMRELFNNTESLHKGINYIKRFQYTNKNFDVSKYMFYIQYKSTAFMGKVNRIISELEELERELNNEIKNDLA
ncbi:MAG: hypothetical protein PHP92_05730 [Candidatus Nanoarchaeia archaeon]|nr:hypothetical protein [Candidatus Nanoarchaeia archaeon]